jgi:Domain of Unknown Function with PDB structure (DUF3857)/Transglutaminase-like superfamily
MTRTLRLAALFTFAAASLPLHAQTNSWAPPTPEELAMTSVPQAPGVPAIYLFKEETADDMLRMRSYYSRIKVLTEGGKDYANVELHFGGQVGISLDSISARTIHPDGTIIPFTGKPYDKVVEKIEGHKIKARVFTLPDVTVGSIIEYRYTLHYDDSYFMHPDWFIQSDLFVRNAHFLWKPNHKSNETIVDSKGNALDRIAWTPILPEGAKVEQKNVNGVTVLELHISDVKPLPREDFMPPIDSVSYRVLFYYTSYTSSAEFWAKEGKSWSKDRDKFIGPGKAVKEAVNSLVAPADSQDVKLHKIYAAVEALENTDFTRERSAREESAAGFKPSQSTDDILTRKRGDGDQLAELFVAMARAAGMKAYLMGVADRSERLFLTGFSSLGQLDDNIAIVNVDGKDRFFDPGQRYCPFGQLAWKHDATGGLRQIDGGGALVSYTPNGAYSNSRTIRIADLVLDEHGEASGPVNITYTGSPALRWRQELLRGDTTSLNADLKENLEHMLPGGVEVEVTGIDNAADYEKPLKVSYTVKGPMGSSTGKRLLLPANLFESNSKARFPQATREAPIDMHFGSIVSDAVRFKLPSGITIESVPADQDGKLAGADQDGKVANLAIFKMGSIKTPTTVTLNRTVVLGSVFFMPKEYSDLRAFYGKIEAKDQETVVLTNAAEATAKSGGSN